MQESSLTVFAQTAMLNHAGILCVATPPPPPKKSMRRGELFSVPRHMMRAFAKAYTEEEKVAVKARGVELLKLFLAAPSGKKIPLSTGLMRVAWDDNDSWSESAHSAEGDGSEVLVPMPLPGAVDTFDAEGEDFQ